MTKYADPLRILIVEDKQSHEDRITEILEGVRDGAGATFDIETASSYDAAYDRVLSSFYDVIVLDLVLHGSPPGDPEGWEGLWLLQDLYELELQRESVVVVLTSFGTAAIADQAFSEFDVVSFWDKDADKKELAARARGLLDSHHHFGLRASIEFREIGGWSDLVSALGETPFRRVQMPLSRPDADRELEHLVRRMFRDVDELVIEPLEPGKSGAAVLRISRRRAGGRLADVLVKYGAAPDIRDEVRCWELMRDYMKDQRLTQLEASAAGRYLGALEYNLIGADPGSVKGFPRYYRAQTSNEVETCVRTLFGESCALWYENAQPADALDIASMISAHVGLSSENVAQAVRFKFGPAAVTDEWVEYDELPRPLPNPLPDFKAGWRPAALDSWTCLVHGDLHGGNVLVDTRRPETGEAWLIDFARSGRGHWATDLALLEAAVKFQYLDATDLRRLFEFEDALARTAELGPLALEDWEEDSELSKAARIVGAIRSFAGSLGHPHTAAQALQEYQIVLYCYTLNYLRFHSLLKARWRKRQVQVAAAVLHERLRALS